MHFISDDSPVNLVVLQRGVVERVGLHFEDCCKQRAVATDSENPTCTLLLLRKPPSFQQLKAIHTLSLLQCVRSYGKGQAISDLVLPTIPMRKVEHLTNGALVLRRPYYIQKTMNTSAIIRSSIFIGQSVSHTTGREAVPPLPSWTRDVVEP